MSTPFNEAKSWGLLRDPAQVKAEHVRRKSKRDVLRAILSDGAVHDSRELVAAVGWRYGARLQEIRDGWAEHPPVVVHRYFLGDGVWAFRMEPNGLADPKCDGCPRCAGGAA